MADFKPVYKKILQFEGGYANDPDDRGGETFAGIARNANPKWAGWAYVDKERKKYPAKMNKAQLKQLNENLFNNEPFMREHILQTKKQYWDAIRGDDIKPQRVAAYIMDFFWGSPAKAISVIKKAVDDVRKRHPQMNGLINNSLLNAINTLPENELMQSMVDQRTQFYKNIVAKNPTQEKFLQGWLRRAKESASGFVQSVENKPIPWAVLALAAGGLYLVIKKKKRNVRG